MSEFKKVLLVEDDAFTRYMMKEIAETLGVDVEIAEDGDAGAQLIAERPTEFGLVLMDLHMPRLSGIDAAMKIRELSDDPPRMIPIIAVTADVNYHDEAVIKKLGMNGYASKPVSPGRLLELISEHCRA